MKSYIEVVHGPDSSGIRVTLDKGTSFNVVFSITDDEAFELAAHMMDKAEEARDVRPTYLAIEKGKALEVTGCKKVDGKCCGKHHKVVNDHKLTFERGSGFPGYRCETCGGWYYQDAVDNKTIDTCRVPDKEHNHFLYIYTDGACSGNPGPGAAAYLIKSGNGTEVTRRVVVSDDATTTNQAQELLAAIYSLEDAKLRGVPKHCAITLYSDSEYVVKGITEWIVGWKKRGWRTASKQSVKNQLLWHRLDELTQALTVEWEWVRGHDGHTENEIVDTMAQDACPKIQR